MDPILIIQIAVPLLAIGGAWGGAKVALNGTKERVQEIKVEIAELDNAHAALLDRAARIETKIDMLMEKK